MIKSKSQTVVVVESPAKAKTIEKLLGSSYKVVASFGHVRDLPKSKLGIDVDKNFEPTYIIPKASAKTVSALKKTLLSADTILLATDFDREGEAIAWHITNLLPANTTQKIKRITFTEITKEAVTSAIKHPRQINQDLVDAQQARRILDRLVGYSLSPVLWEKVKRGLSAGRVQSVALKLIVDREREIAAFLPDEYWSLEAILGSNGEEFSAELSRIDDKKVTLTKEAEVQDLLKSIAKATFKVATVTEKQTSRSPAPPFITSTLQQEASRKLGYGSRKTMVIAQKLYEGIDLGSGPVGLISYMRTDSFNLSVEALHGARGLVESAYGKQYLPDKARVFKKKVRGAQEAHEAIRPTDFQRTPDELKTKLLPEQYRLYRLIWQRAVASQMNDALYLSQGADIKAMNATFRATGRKTVFDGFTKLYSEGEDQPVADQTVLPDLCEGETLQFKEFVPKQHFTQPPPRFTEASLIKKLEEAGIGRPSTYAPIISTLLNRNYILIESRQIRPEPTGETVSDLLSKHFDFVVDEGFTVKIEDRLDDIAEGKSVWQPIVKAFYDPLSKQIAKETPKIIKQTIPDVPADIDCDVCGKAMVVKTGRFGKFIACTGFPECKNTKRIQKDTGLVCPKDKGQIVERRTKKGRMFYGCSNWPACDFASWQKPKELSKSA